MADNQTAVAKETDTERPLRVEAESERDDADDVTELLVEDVSIDGMCGVY
jgi:mycofactocin precursor